MFLINYLLMKQIKMHIDFSRRKMTTPVKISYRVMPLRTEGVISPATEVSEHIFYFYTFSCIYAYYVPLLKEVKTIFIS